MLRILLIFLFLLPALAGWLPEEMVVEEARAVAQVLGLFSECEETTVLALLIFISCHQPQEDDCCGDEEHHKDDECYFCFHFASYFLVLMIFFNNLMFASVAGSELWTTLTACLADRGAWRM